MDNHTQGIITYIPVHSKPYFSVITGFFCLCFAMNRTADTYIQIAGQTVCIFFRFPDQITRSVKAPAPSPRAIIPIVIIALTPVFAPADI